MNQNRPCPYCGSGDAGLRFLEPPFRVVKCRNCSLVYLANPPDDQDIYEQYYHGDGFDVAQYRRESEDPSIGELFAINNQRISVLKRIKPSGTLLDIGCGRGAFLKTAADHGYIVEGIDLSERAILCARDGFHMNARVDTVENVSSSGAHFDVVTLWHVLEHFSDPFKSMKLVRSLLSETGVFVMEVPNLHSLKFLAARQKWEGGNHPRYHRTFFTHDTLKRGLLKAGFSKVRRLKVTYHVPDRSASYEALKRMLNLVGMDAFLMFVAHK